jgi:hypothetical protein
MAKRTGTKEQPAINNNDTQKTKDRATRTPPKPGGELMCSEGQVVPDPLVAPVVLLWLQSR